MGACRFIGLCISLLSEIAAREATKIQQAGEMIAESISRDGVIHIFGTGHSHIIAEEAYARAGGLVAVAPMLEPSLMLHEGVDKSAALEKLPGLAKVLLDSHSFDVRPEDVGIIVSNSGRNACPIEMAVLLKERGVKVIAITSMAHATSVASRHPSGKKLHDIADLVLDNMGVPGDAALEFTGLRTKACPTSTVTGVAILWSVIEAAIEKLAEQGEPPPVLVSQNLDEADAFSVLLTAKARARYLGSRGGTERKDDDLARR